MPIVRSLVPIHNIISRRARLVTQIIILFSGKSVNSTMSGRGKGGKGWGKESPSVTGRFSATTTRGHQAGHPSSRPPYWNEATSRRATITRPEQPGQTNSRGQHEHPGLKTSEDTSLCTFRAKKDSTCVPSASRPSVSPAVSTTYPSLKITGPLQDQTNDSTLNQNVP